MAAFDRAMDQAKRARLVAKEKEHRAAAEALLEMVATLNVASSQANALATLAKLKEE
jgi:hypothetical protein